MKYSLINILFLAPITVAWLVLRPVRFMKFLMLLLIMLLLTAIFDNIIIMTGIVAYHPSNLLGWYIGQAPVEDFSYTLAITMLVTLIWRPNKNSNANRNA